MSVLVNSLSKLAADSTALQNLRNEAERNSGNLVSAGLDKGGNRRAETIDCTVYDEHCRRYLESFKDLHSYNYPAQSITLINRPCYIVVASGVIISEDGKILKETVYPSTGESTVERLVGGGVTDINLEQLLSEAETLDVGICTPALSRWSNVYFHAVTEALVQDAAIYRAGLLPHITYVAPTKISKVQEMVLKNTNARVVRTDAPIVKAPRALITSLLYSHAVMGFDFTFFVNMIKSRYGSIEVENCPEKIYVSRLGSPARPMLNESELISELTKIGFHIFSADELTFQEQVTCFRKARFVVGPHGAGLTNAAFSQPGTILLELRPLNRKGESPMWGSSYLKMSAACDFRYCAHVSRNGFDQEAWECNIDEVLKTITKLEIDL